MNNAKLDLEKRFDSKKERVLQKINLLKSQNTSIEDIYKYTNEIIFEEIGE